MVKKLSPAKLEQLREALNFLHMAELRDLCVKLSLGKTGKKGALVYRILHFLETGKESAQPEIPEKSCAQRGRTYELTPSMLMLKGAYKNDLKTRLFFKKLIGDYFHFTAFGIDWLNERWIRGNPPTYQEFAEMWRAEYARRKQQKAQPKEEWAYITFVQNFIEKHPDAPRAEIMRAWEQERKKNVALVYTILKSLLGKN